ncbi:MFS transporter [Pectinatus frisingensis]|uniref:MFS transporter n=1 Tax=Pectinatus frisingensis TaxID=865 RepID=UPI0018C7D590|nr:MFS transporter [Pectinatus frisingensis]
MFSKLRGNNRLILFITVLAPFMATIDTSVTNIALPVMANALHVSSAAVAWVANAYFITLIADIILFGKLGDIYGQAKIFQLGILIFTIGSLLCSLAPTLPLLIAARIIQAIGGGATMANSQAIIVRAFPGADRGKALGINGAFVALGFVTGPSLGGFIIALAGWPYMFLINIPFGLLVFIGGLLIFPHERQQHIPLDFKGALLFALSMSNLFYILQESQIHGFFTPFILICSCISVISFLLFIKLERQITYPVLDLHIFENNLFSISIFCAFTSYMAISAFSFIMPFYLEYIRQLDSASAGLYMSLYPLLLIVVSPLCGALSDHIGAERLTIIGLSLTACGLFLVGFITVNTSLSSIALLIALLGIGNGAFQPPNNYIVMSSVPSNKIGIAGSVNALIRYIGNAAGIAVANTLLYTGMSIIIGHHITTFTNGHNIAFLFGMKSACIVIAVICTLGVILTIRRRLYKAAV